MKKEKIKKIIGSICKYLMYSLLGLLVFFLFVVLFDIVGLLKATILIMGGILVVFIIWAAVNWD